ncbi:hypothetical protein EW146_g4614 [Bondarzewia mesenterica]|uniref:Structural maintenance of chromosomes protein 5 n=1 Tax=Bondarzewia mesenterica TaxID=1095465 RepID=A0A4V6S1G3_9AGAM|nr:hypothetical protein EW146_g4614 [Bondarzewia mesenterica]
MARRAQIIEEDKDGSQKENSRPSSTAGVKTARTVKPEKTDQATREVLEPEDGVEENEMVEGDVELEDDKEEDEEEELVSPKGRKRARVNEDGDARPVKDEKGEVKAHALTRDVDGYVTGSIVRVKLENFVTYDHVEFCPGPHLNMIIGPNGTGKSSIACAIALGLNWPPSILGRASELNSFVKMGTNQGSIEIELKGPVGKPNLVIKRHLSAKSKGSTFTLNGKSATGREVTQKMNELDIQVGNLCSFLPQDKVSEFAAMSPQQLLRETQRAAGDERLTAWHDALIGSGRELKELEELLNTDQQNLKTLEDRNAMLERDVQRYNERKEIERKIALHQLILPFVEYIDARARYAEAKAKQRQLHKLVRELKEKNAPAHDFKKRLEDRHKQLNAQREKKKKDVQKKFKSMKSKWAENERLENEADSVSTQLSNLKKNEKDRMRKIRELDGRIKDMQHQLDNPVKTEPMDDVLAEIRQLQQANQGIRQRQTDLQERQVRNVENSSKANAELQQGKTEHVSRLFSFIRPFSFCRSDWRNWTMSSIVKFRMDIMDPAIVSLTVPNKSFVDAVEACFSGMQLRTFVAQCDEDYQLFNRLVVDTPEALGRKARVMTWYRRDDGRVAPPPMGLEELHALGFDGYALEYVECPDGLLNFLKRDCQFHRTAIGLNASRIDPNRAMEAVAHGGGGSYTTGSTMNQVLRSRYGRQLSQNMSREFGQARNLTFPTIDPTLKRMLEQRVSEATANLEVCRNEAAALAEEDRAIKAEHNDMKKKHDALETRKRKVQEEKNRLQGLKVRLDTSRTRLEELQAAPSADAERANLKKQLLDLTKKRANIAKQYADLVRAAIRDQQDATKVGLQFLQVGSNKVALENYIEEQDVEYRKALSDFHQGYLAKTESHSKLAVSKTKLAEVDEDIREEFRLMEESGEAHEKTVDEVKDELESLQQKLNLVLQTNPGVVDQYERRKAEIEALTKKIEERERKAKKVDKAIKIARESWEPALRRLIDSIGRKFSAAFDRIGCAGELAVQEHEDYDKWRIDIRVKFRDGEKLQLLTAQRQSGGERSLTTILYLMSMTEQAHAPFSLVDEINQGMDQRAERAVHDQLVETTCKADSGQYFLITPKLLPDLRYHELMKILCVNNGEWLPEDTGLGNMMSMIETL